MKWRVQSWNILWKSLADINQDGSPCWSMKIPNPSCAISWSTEKSVKDIFTSLNYFTFYIHQIRYVLHTLYVSENLWLSNELFHNPKWKSWDNFMAHFTHHWEEVCRLAIFNVLCFKMTNIFSLTWNPYFAILYSRTFTKETWFQNLYTEDWLLNGTTSTWSHMVYNSLIEILIACKFDKDEAPVWMKSFSFGLCLEVFAAFLSEFFL